MFETEGSVVVEETVQEVAAPAQETVEDTQPVAEEGVGEAAEAGQQQEERIPDSVWAASRRRAEAEARRRYDGEIERRFGSFKHPDTGKPIKTLEEYLSALDAQADAGRRAQLKAKGIDPAVIDDAVANSPLMRQAQQVLEQQRAAEGERRFNEQMAAITAIDGDYKSLADLQREPEFAEFDRRVREGEDMVSAFRNAFFERIISKRAAAGRQAALNAVKGKGHLNTVGVGGTVSRKGVDIPASVLATWQDMFPDDSAEQLRARYNKSL